MSAHIAVVGSLNRDVTVPVDRLPGPGDTVVATGPSTLNFGGKGGNQAAAAAAYLQQPGAVAMVGCVGDDADGRATLADLRDYGIDVSGIRMIADVATARATIAVDPSGENLIVVDAGANANLTAADVVKHVRRADVVLTQLEIPVDVVRAAVDAANGKVILNPAPYADVRELVDKVEVLVPNRSELAHLVGERPAADVDTVVRQVRQLDVRATVIVTLGAQGALVMGGGSGTEHIQAPTVPVVDTTGAGDCFCGVFAALLAGGTSIIDAARTAVQAAAISVGSASARGHLPRRTDLSPSPSTHPAGGSAWR